jgi:hypothetical protein
VFIVVISLLAQSRNFWIHPRLKCDVGITLPEEEYQRCKTTGMTVIQENCFEMDRLDLLF